MVTPEKLNESGPLKRLSRTINDVNALAQSMRIQRGLGYSVRHTPHGQVIQLEDRRGTSVVEPGSKVQRFAVVQPFNDYLSCLRVKENGAVDVQTTYYVAKPEQLRVSYQLSIAEGNRWRMLGYPFRLQFPLQNGGATRQFAIDSIGQPTRYVEEVLFPQYFGGDEIYAAEAEGKTGVTVDGKLLTWIDLNVDARAYRPIYTRMAVCVTENGQNVTKYIYVAGGPVLP